MTLAAHISPDTTRALVRELNQTCFCVTLDRTRLASAMHASSGVPEFFDEYIGARPHLFSNTPVFLAEADRDAILSIIAAVESVAAMSTYRESVLSWAPEASRTEFGPAGALMGYDFHLAQEGPPRLIEINTNAGGAFLNAFSARAQLACCDPVEPLKKGSYIDGFDDAVIAMFTREWELQRGTAAPEGRPLRLAIVDDNPREQYLYPEFLLARSLLNARGFQALLCDPEELTFADGMLCHQSEPIDIVYNRLVDFALEEPRHAALRAAWLTGATVVTPSPFHHAVMADKRNLATLSNADALARLGAEPAAIEILSALPRTELVTPESADRLWTARRTLFFKPVSGYGGRAVYRGDKLTRSVWADILSANYVAQELAPPGERQILIDGELQMRKMDVRMYTYDGAPLLTAARLYQGQTTNFRTPGGGFAPVYFV